tara:strand:- start:595 stop:1206 length:612 start_codon:yes stop_codon:yes gene_type:complete
MAWQSDYYRLSEHFISADNVQNIENLLKRFPLEDITIGDAGEINRCQVGRLIEDRPGESPAQLNVNLSTPVLDYFRTPAAMSFFSQYFSGNKDLTIRRSQFNLLHQHSFVGKHLDVDSNPDYQIAAVLQLGSKFTGGDFIVYESPVLDSEKSATQVVSPDYGSLTISKCNHPHEVSSVLSGTRTSLVCFISDYSGPNRRIQHA